MYEVFEKLLRQKGVTAYAVAKATGVSTATFTEWKKGTYQLKINKLMKIADFLGVPVNVFLDALRKEGD